MKKFLFCFLLLFLLIPSYAYSKIGVGVGTGKIVVDEKLKPGMLYKLPSLTVLNTGDEPSEYAVSVAYHSNQSQLTPAKDWFIFSPEKFSLKPGEAKVVDIKVNLPVNIRPGDYFAYLEGRPAIKSEQGATTIGIAAAAKLYFTVVPGNIFQGIYYKVITFWQIYSPWTDRAAVAAALVVLALVVKRFFNIQIDLKKPAKNQDTKPAFQKLKIEDPKNE